MRPGRENRQACPAEVLSSSPDWRSAGGTGGGGGGAGQGRGGWALGRGGGRRLTGASAFGAPEDQAAHHLGQHAAQQRVQQQDGVTLGQTLADATHHQGYDTAHLAHSHGQHTLGRGQRQGTMGPAPARSTPCPAPAGIS